MFNRTAQDARLVLVGLVAVVAFQLSAIAAADEWRSSRPDVDDAVFQEVSAGRGDDVVSETEPAVPSDEADVTTGAPAPAIVLLDDLSVPELPAVSTEIANESPRPGVDVEAVIGCGHCGSVGTCACDEEPCDGGADECLDRFETWLGYNAREGSITWLAGDDFGMTSLESYPTLDVGDESGLTFGNAFHFLSGPTGAADLPPRLFDFQMAYHVRKPLNDATTLDLKLGVGAFSDFQTSARKGIRFPGHVVFHTALDDQVASVFGVDVLDRDDISLLPVVGVIWRPADDLFVDFVFPRPRVRLRVNDERIMYFGGELGGGTWAVRRDDGTRDNATYRDIRVTWGLSSTDADSETVLEIGWAFDRELAYRTRRGDTAFDGAFILRWQTNY